MVSGAISKGLDSVHFSTYNGRYERMAWPQHQCMGKPMYQLGSNGPVLFQPRVCDRQYTGSTCEDPDAWFIGTVAQAIDMNCSSAHSYGTTVIYVTDGHSRQYCMESPDNINCSSWQQTGIPGCIGRDNLGGGGDPGCHVPILLTAAGGLGCDQANTNPKTYRGFYGTGAKSLGKRIVVR
jgi:hypothetical protein